MQNKIQLDNYKKLMAYINEHFKEDINSQRIEEICHYSYRNINRIFQAIHGETVGKYIKRIRLEKAAEYLKYSSNSRGGTSHQPMSLKCRHQCKHAFSCEIRCTLYDRW